ncbi:hypothetical protein BHM03_00026528, partial [Ensete ventricosum]
TPGDLVDAIVPFMGESITDGTLATFMKSMYFALCSMHIDMVVDAYAGILFRIYIVVNLKSLMIGVEVDEPVAQIETDTVLMFDFYSVAGYSNCFHYGSLTDMMKLQSEYKDDAFVEKHGVKLGLTSGFVKVCGLIGD